MARIDDVVYQYLNLPGNAEQSSQIKQMLELAIRYGFKQGERYGKFEQYGEQTMRELTEKLEKSEAEKKPEGHHGI